MPGITGIIAKHSAAYRPEQIHPMLRIMLHESFYTSGIYQNAEVGVSIGFVSLPGPFSECMPIYNENKDLVMFFSGECYGDAETKERLRRQGHQFAAEGASYLVHLFEETGEESLQALNGWFSGVIVDIARKKVFLFNDRYGIQRIYYHETEQLFFFSSEAKSLLTILPALREIDLRSFGEFYAFDCVLEHRTLFSDIFLLPPASCWNFDGETIVRTCYFDPRTWEDQTPLPDAQFEEALCETFVNILPRYFSGSPMGMSLTGGLDTRLILACCQPEPETMPCYTFGSMYHDSLDVRIARQVAAVCHQPHYTLRIDRAFLSDFSTHASKTIFVSDGAADVCLADTLYLNARARAIAPIRMTGKWGSQVLRHLSLLRERPRKNDLLHHDVTPQIARARETFSRLKQTEHPLSFILFKEIPWWWSRFTLPELSQTSVRSPYLDIDLIRLLYQTPEKYIHGPDRAFQWKLIERYHPQLYAIMTDKGLSGRTLPLRYLPISILYKTLNSIDFKYNSEYLASGRHHLIARLDALFTPLHPENFIAGYCNFRHYRLWFRTYLSEYVQEMLLDDRTLNRPYWDKNRLKDVVSNHLNGQGNYLFEIRKALTLELIHRTLLEK